MEISGHSEIVQNDNNKIKTAAAKRIHKSMCLSFPCFIMFTNGITITQLCAMNGKLQLFFDPLNMSVILSDVDIQCFCGFGIADVFLHHLPYFLFHI